MKILELKHIHKQLNDAEIKDVNLKLQYGEIYGLISNSLRDKQLMMRLLTGLVKPDRGEIFYFSRKRKHGSSVHLRRVGIVMDDVYFYDELSGFDNIRLYLDAYKKRLNKLDTLSLKARIHNYFKLFNLMTSMDVPVKKYSIGMRRKLMLIRAFVIEPRVLILDEPFKSLDPITIIVLQKHLRELSKKKGVTIFMTTSMVGYLNTLVDRIGIMMDGELVEELTTEALQFHQQGYLSIEARQLPYLLTIIEREFKLYDYEVIDDNTVKILENYDHMEHLVSRLLKSDVEIISMKYGIDSMENYFLRKIGD